MVDLHSLIRTRLRLAGCMLAAIFLATTAHGQTLVAADDVFSVPYGEDLLVEAPGALGNDTYNGEPAEDAGAAVSLVTPAADGVLILSSDGSFSYAPGPDFTGLDTFTYQAAVGGSTSQATVTLTACSAGPGAGQYVCWKEFPYVGKLSELGFGTFQEGFESDATWGSARSPSTAPSVFSQGIEWMTNHPDPPASNEITTGSGPARTGLWGVYDPEHGYATGTSTECDVDVPPTYCLFKDGFTATNEPGETPLYGVGGYFTGAAQPNLVVILDGGPPISLGRIYVGDHQFFGVIDTGGLTSCRFEETDGKIGQARLVFADDFTFAQSGPFHVFSDGFESGGTLAWSTTYP